MEYITIACTANAKKTVENILQALQGMNDAAYCISIDDDTILVSGSYTAGSERKTVSATIQKGEVML